MTEGSLGERIDAITSFLAALEQPNAAGSWSGGDRNPDGTITMPWFDYSETALSFMRACASNGWVDATFAWPEWKTEAQLYIDRPAQIAGAGVGDLRRLLTTHIRGDRFSEGHFAAAVETGHIAAILRRLMAIREELAASDSQDDGVELEGRFGPSGPMGYDERPLDSRHRRRNTE